MTSDPTRGAPERPDLSVPANDAPLVDPGAQLADPAAWVRALAMHPQSLLDVLLAHLQADALTLYDVAAVDEPPVVVATAPAAVDVDPDPLVASVAHAAHRLRSGRRVFLPLRGGGRARFVLAVEGLPSRDDAYAQVIADLWQANRERTEQLAAGKEPAAGNEGQLQSLRTQLLTVASHELRTPLAIAQGWAQLLADESAEPAERSRHARSIVRQTRAMTRTVERMFMLVQYDNDELRASVAETSITDLLRAAAENLSIPAPHISGPDVTVQTDASFLRQVFEAVLDRSLHGSPDALTSIEVDVDGGFAHVVFVDRNPLPIGAGEMFDVDEVDEDQQVSPHGGLGLALAIASRLAHVIGGSVDTSELEDNRITVKIPLG